MKINAKTVSFTAVGFLLVGLIAYNAMNPGLGNPVAFDGSIDSAMVQSQVQEDKAILLDVRTSVEYDLDHAPNSLNHNVEFMKDGEMPDLDKSDRIYVYCRSGNRSAVATELMKEAGFKDVVDIGGLQDWVEGGGELIPSELGDYQQLLSELGVEPIEPLGPDDADVVVTKYADFSCPYCARYTLETEPLILSNFVNSDDSNVRYEFRNYTYLGDESAIAANGGYCANEQSLFWKFHDRISAGFAAAGDEFYNNDQFVNVVGDIGGDTDVFRTCVESDKYYPVISAETQDVKNQGIESTPTITVNDEKLEGALPYDVFKTAIKEAL
ncbi:MAG: thioredoxin domain-containing protein [Candidatus Saccharimonadales bacterium]|nr:thioredoxin domain-containing protein [Candidatus Saccharimonadales bacterium]